MYTYIEIHIYVFICEGNVALLDKRILNSFHIFPILFVYLRSYTYTNTHYNLFGLFLALALHSYPSHFARVARNYSNFQLYHFINIIFRARLCLCMRALVCIFACVASFIPLSRSLSLDLAFFLSLQDKSRKSMKYHLLNKS